MNYETIANHITEKILENLETYKEEFSNSSPIRHFVVDGLLPIDIVRELHQKFPRPDHMLLNSSLRERKYVSANMDRHHSLLKDCIFAFQHPKVVKAVAEVIGKKDLFPDDTLYAGGLTLMTHGHYLNPHIDHSHNRHQNRWRNLNLLYYVSQKKEDDLGGDLELWPSSVSGQQETIESKFNRLVVMETHQHAWHSVSPIQSNFHRQCISNYFFGSTSMRDDESYHVTSFRGRPEQKIRDFWLRKDAMIRGWVRTLFPKGLKSSNQDYTAAK